VTAYDGTDAGALDRRMAVRNAHLALGSTMRDRGELLYAVAILNDREVMIGSMCILEFPSRSELEAWLKIEPYVTGGVWESIDIVPCRVGPGFSQRAAP
jgi:uncharacterized protein YciI